MWGVLYQGGDFMRMFAYAKCKNIEERQLIIDMLGVIGVTPLIDDLEVEVDYDLPDGPWSLYFTETIDRITGIFELATKHNIRFLS